MQIHEFQAKNIFKEYGIPVPEGQVTTNPKEAISIMEKLNSKVVVKAQVHSGGRGKVGGVKLAVYLALSDILISSSLPPQDSIAP